MNQNRANVLERAGLFGCGFILVGLLICVAGTVAWGVGNILINHVPLWLAVFIAIPIGIGAAFLATVGETDATAILVRLVIVLFLASILAPVGIKMRQNALKPGAPSLIPPDRKTFPVLSPQPTLAPPLLPSPHPTPRQ